MAQRTPNGAGVTIERGTRLTDYSSVDVTVEGFASGGMGLVVWGRNAFSSGETIALKLLKPDRLAAAPSREARASIERQFETEALTWCHLWHHQSIITAFGLTRLPALDGLLVLQLEYAPHGSVRDLLKFTRQQRRPLPIGAALALATHVAAALTHIHQRDPGHGRPDPLVHCDLKPENVLLNSGYGAMLTDLGLTRAYAALAAETLPSIQPGAAGASVDRQTLVAQLRADLQGQGLLPGMAAGAPPPLPDAATLFATRTLAIPPTAAVTASVGPGAATPVADELIGVGVAGSPPYMAPEQWRGLGQTVPATDVYAFGVLLYELFAGFETPAPFPRDPSPYLTPERYARALATGVEPVTLAWHAAHTDPAYRTGGRGVGGRRLSDPDLWAAALRVGPCAELLADGSVAGRQRAEACLAGIDALVERCLAYASGARPTAAEVVTDLRALVVDQCGLAQPELPRPISDTPETEAAFWGNIGMTYSKLDRQAEAIDAKRRALRHDPSDAVNWLNLAASLDKFGEQAMRDAVAADPEEAVRLSAEAAQAFEEALQACDKGRACLTPKLVATYSGLPASFANVEAGTLGLLGRFQEAVAADEYALSLNPDIHDTRFNLALHYTMWSQDADATLEERRERLEAAQRELAVVLAVAPGMVGGRVLAQRLARALADPQHRLQG